MTTTVDFYADLVLVAGCGSTGGAASRESA